LAATWTAAAGRFDGRGAHEHAGGEDGERRPARRAVGAQLRGPWRRQLGAAGQDLRLQGPELTPRLEAELLDGVPPAVAVDLQRVGLASAAVQREHQLTPQPLAQRVRPQERLELDDHLPVPAERQVGIDPALQRRQPQLLEPRDLVLGERLVGEVDQWRSTPELQPLPQPRRGVIGAAVGERALALRQRPLEPGDVHAVGRHLEHVAVRAGAQRHPVPAAGHQVLAQE
jgi:hypothetical protein